MELWWNYLIFVRIERNGIKSAILIISVINAEGNLKIIISIYESPITGIRKYEVRIIFIAIISIKEQIIILGIEIFLL